MDLIKPGTRFDFVARQKPFLILSVVLVLASIVLVGTVGLNFGVDFRGGSELILHFDKPVTSEQVRAGVVDMGFEQPDVQEFGDAAKNRFLIRIPRSSSLNATTSAAIEKSVAAEVGEIRRYTWSEEGGDIIYIRFTGEIDQAKLAATLDKAGIGRFVVTKHGTEERPEYHAQLQELQERLAEVFATKFGADTFNQQTGIERSETVGPRVGEQLRNNGLLSVLLALLLILIYIAFRFDVRYAPGAVIALFHDVTITLGVYAAAQQEVTLPIIAALLTIVGYSLNDTIVIFDRIRENFSALANKDVKDIVNISVNDSLNRTILTSVTTLLAVLALYIFGGGLVKNFAFALIVGVMVGTYSSTFVASPILIAMHNLLEARKATKAAAEAEKRIAKPKSA